MSGVSPKVLTDLEFTITGPEDFGENGTMTLKVKQDCTLSDEMIVCKVNGKVPTGKYTVKENNTDVEFFTLVDAIGDGETKKVNKNDQVVFEIKNVYEVDKVSYTVIKIWDDGHNKDGIRPKKLTVNLYGDEEFVSGKDLSVDYKYTGEDLPEEYDSEDVWMYEFKNLPVANEMGELISYVAEEDFISDDYEEMNDGDDYFTVFVNYYEPTPDDPCADGEGCGGDVIPPIAPETGKLVKNTAGAISATGEQTMVVVLTLGVTIVLIGVARFIKRK